MKLESKWINKRAKSNPEQEKERADHVTLLCLNSPHLNTALISRSRGSLNSLAVNYFRFQKSFGFICQINPFCRAASSLSPCLSLGLLLFWLDSVVRVRQTDLNQNNPLPPPPCVRQQLAGSWFISQLFPPSRTTLRDTLIPNPFSVEPTTFTAAAD